MSREVHGTEPHRYVWFSTRPVFRVRFKSEAHAIWSSIYDDCECDKPEDISFFEERAGVEFDVYAWEQYPKADAENTFFDVDDNDRVLHYAMFDSVSPEISA